MPDSASPFKKSEKLNNAATEVSESDLTDIADDVCLFEDGKHSDELGCTNMGFRLGAQATKAAKPCWMVQPKESCLTLFFIGTEEDVLTAINGLAETPPKTLKSPE